MTTRYQQALHEAQSELDDLLVRQAQGEKRIAQLKLTINGLKALCEAAETMEETRKSLASLPPSMPIEEMGFTALVREIFKAAQKALVPADVRDEMVRIGYNVRKYKNLMAAIHIVFKRLERAGEIEPVDIEIDQGDGSTLFYTAHVFVPEHERVTEEPAKEAFKRALRERAEKKAKEKEDKRQELLKIAAARKGEIGKK